MKIFARIISFILIIVGCFGLFLTFQNSDELNITNYEYTSSKVPTNFNNYKIVQLSDMHAHSVTYSNGNIVDKIKSVTPNIIVLTGDFVDSKEYAEEDLKYLFDNLKEYPIYYVNGNHEATSPHTEKFMNLLQTYENVQIMIDKYMQISVGDESVNLFGLHDPYFDYKENFLIDKNYGTLDKTLSELTQKAPASSLSILLSHRPTIVDLYAKYNMDLVFTGHTHGYQIDLSNAFPFIYPKYNAGEYYYEGTTMYVSRGLGYSRALPVRLNCNAEIVVSTLKCA